MPVAFLVHHGVVFASHTPVPPLRHPPTLLAQAEKFHAPRSGILVYAARIGEVVKPGDPLCDVVDPFTDEATAVTSRSGGMFYMRRAIRFVTAGAEIGRLTGC